MPAWSNSLDLEIKPVDEIRLLKGWDSQSWYIISTNAYSNFKINNIRALQLHSYNKCTNNKPSINVQVMKYITI